MYVRWLVIKCGQEQLRVWVPSPQGWHEFRILRIIKSLSFYLHAYPLSNLPKGVITHRPICFLFYCSVYLSAYLSAYTCLPVYLSACMHISLSTCMISSIIPALNGSLSSCLAKSLYIIIYVCVYIHANEINLNDLYIASVYSGHLSDKSSGLVLSFK